MISLKDKCFIAIALFYIAYLAFPLISSLTHIPIWSVCIFTSLALLMMYPYSINQNFIIWFIIYCVILIIYCICDHPFHINGMGSSNAAHRRLIIEIAWILPNILIASVVIKSKSIHIYEILGMGILIILFLSLLSLLPSLLTYSRILRENSTLVAAGEEEIANNLPGYTLMSCYVYFVPVLCYAFKKTSGLLKLFFLFTLSLFVFAIIKTEITTSFVSVVLLLLFTIIYKVGKGATSRTITNLMIFLVLFIIVYTSGFFHTILNILVDLYQGTSAESKFIEFRDMYLGKGQGHNLSVRKNLRMLSFQCFMNNPLIGSPGVGEHSSLLDRLGSMGILGFIPYMAMLLTNVKSWYKLMPDTPARFFYLAGILIVFVFLYLKGLFSGEGMLFLTVLLPVPLIYIYNFTKYKNE